MSKSSAPRLKLVIRRLPPTLPEDVFWRAIAPFVEDHTLWRRYVKGRAGDNFGTHPIHSRAYVLMKDVDALVALHAGFDGHVFRSKTGAEYQAVVEYAPIGKTPYKSKNKADQRQGTIEEDPDYKSFLDTLEAVEPKPALETSTPVAQPTTTPILDALRAQQAKSSKKSKKEKEKEKKAGATKAAALASITDAASKRAPKDKVSGVVMVAGKGRDVYVGSVDEMAAVKDASSTEKKKRQRPPKKKKEDVEGDKTNEKRADKKEESNDGKKDDKPREPRQKKEKGKDKAKVKEKEKEAKGPSQAQQSNEPPQASKPKEKGAGDEVSREGKKRVRTRKGRGGGGGGSGAGGSGNGGANGDDTAGNAGGAEGRPDGSKPDSNRPTAPRNGEGKARPVAASEARIDM